METVRHGLTSIARRCAPDPLLAGVGAHFEVGHYHSWCADLGFLPDCWSVTAEVQEDPSIPLALRHRTLPLHAVQFHPESVLTPEGRSMLAAWLEDLK